MHLVSSERRHCDRCVKQVTDFTRSTDGQILAAYRRSGGNICGRFRADQLDRNLLDTARPATWWSKAATWLGLAFVSSALHGQETQLPVKAPVEVNESVLDVVESREGVKHEAESGNEKFFVEGVVVDSEGYPLIGATILIEGTTTGTVTDFDGRFSIEVEEGNVLIVSYTGYTTERVIASTDVSIIQKHDLQINAERHTVSVNVELVDDLVLSGEIIVVGGIGRHRPNTLFDEVKWMLHRWKYYRDERAEERAERRAERRANRIKAREEVIETKSETADVFAQPVPFVVFPNPSNGPVSLQFKSDTEQQLMIEVTDAAGKPIYFSPWQVFKGENILTLSAEQLIGAGGAYLIRLVGDEKMWTEKVVVKQ